MRSKHNVYEDQQIQFNHFLFLFKPHISPLIANQILHENQLFTFIFISTKINLNCHKYIINMVGLVNQIVLDSFFKLLGSNLAST
jgi:hypothetical protein